MLCVLLSSAIIAQAAPSGDRRPESDFNFSVEIGVQYAIESNLFWNLSDTFAPTAGFDPDRDWWEGYVEPGVTFSRDLDGGTLRGGLSGVLSGTGSADPYDFSDIGRATLETAYLAYETGVSGWTLDLSAGAQEYRLGSGMMIANGASNGFERGALKLGPRKAWEMTAIATLSRNGLTLEAFYLDPNELSSNDSETRLAGASIAYVRDSVGQIGVYAGHVLNSAAPYPQAIENGPPNILPGAREGLNFYNIYGELEPGVLGGGAYATFDLAIERHQDIALEAWAGRFELGWLFADHPWRPNILYGFQTFSGDDPSTPELERFDPLYYEGSPGAWGTGSKASMVLINTNVHAHQFEASFTPSPRDIITAYYSHTRVNELRSPLQFGQATRVDFEAGVPVLFSGVTEYGLSDDVFVKYTRVINPNVYLTAGASISFPGDGIEAVVDGGAETWSGAFINLVAAY